MHGTRNGFVCPNNSGDQAENRKKQGAHAMQLGWTGFDEFIEQRVAEGATMEDFLLVVPQSLGAMPTALEVARGPLSVMSSDIVDRVYLMDLRTAQQGLMGLCSRP